MKKFKYASVAAIAVVLAVFVPLARNATTPEPPVVTAVLRTADGFVSDVNGDVVTVELWTATSGSFPVTATQSVTLPKSYSIPTARLIMSWMILSWK